MPPAPARLITIAFSHYCEKARWALDHIGAPYVEEPHLPGLHARPARAAGGRTVPVLVTDAGTLTDSADILAWCDARAPEGRRLYPRDAGARREVEAIEAGCNRDLGPAARLFVYHHGLPAPRALVRAVRPALTPLQAWVMPLFVPVLGVGLRRTYGIDEGSAARAAEVLRRAFAELSARLAGHRHFVGDAFTAADLTFASLTAPIVRPDGHPSMTATLDDASGPLRAMTEELRATPAGAHAQRVYREHRRTKKA